MANTKKPRSERKKVVSMSIKTRHYEDFVDNCNRLGIPYSNKAEELIANFNKSLLQ